MRVGDAETSIDAVGTLIPNEAVAVRPEVDGRVATINFVEGGTVPTGRIESRQREFTALAETDLRTVEQSNDLIVRDAGGYLRIGAAGLGAPARAEWYGPRPAGYA